MKLYAYCLSEGIETLPAPLHGILGAKVRLLKLGNFSLLVSEISADAVPVTRDNALAHAAVVRSMLDEITPLPFRFGTLVTEEDLRSYLTARQEPLQARLAYVRDCVEMSVKIIWDRDWTEAPAPQDQVREKPGTAFLFEKRREMLGSETRTAEAKKIASWLGELVGDVVRDTWIKTNPTEKLLLATSHLVERKSLYSYRTRLDEARNQRPELHFLVSGPWAPYSFAHLDLEFKTQFGVN